MDMSNGWDLRIGREGVYRQGHQGAGLADGPGWAMAFKLIEAAQDRWRRERPAPGRPGTRRSPLRTRDPHRAPRDHRGMTTAGEPRAYESRQLVVTLPGVIRTVTHSGSGPANPG